MTTPIDTSAIQVLNDSGIDFTVSEIVATGPVVQSTPYQYLELPVQIEDQRES